MSAPRSPALVPPTGEELRGLDGCQEVGTLGGSPVADELYLPAPRCPFCMSETWHSLAGTSRRDQTFGMRACVKHERGCPRFCPCMACGEDAITGFYGLCGPCWDSYCDNFREER